MFDVKISAIIAGLAFIISFLLGMVTGASFPVLVIRPLIFAVLFFVIAGIIYFLVSHFLPELLDEGRNEIVRPDDILNPGSRINITEDEPAGPAVYAAPPDDSEDNLGNISDLLTKGRVARPPKTDFPGLDQHGEDRYTRSDSGSVEDRNDGGSAESGSAMPKTAAVSDPVESMDVLPDLDTMARAFLPDSGEDEADTTEYSASDDSPKRPAAGSRGKKMEGDFNPKELAAGIRTILKKEG
jgi:hypothetical protein